MYSGLFKMRVPSTLDRAIFFGVGPAAVHFRSSASIVSGMELFDVALAVFFVGIDNDYHWVQSMAPVFYVPAAGC